MVWGGNPVAEIPQLDVMQAKVFVLEADAGGLEPGIAATVVLDAHPGRAYRATVKQVDALAQPRTGACRCSTSAWCWSWRRTDPELMKPGQRVQADLDSRRTAGRAHACPGRPCSKEDEGSVVYVARGGGFEPVQVELGAAGLGRVVIESGVEDGDRVALRDPTRPLRGPEEENGNGRERVRHRVGRGRIVTWIEAFRSALGNLAAHKLRSALTMLGMIFGVGAVIAMLSIGAGAEQQAMEMIERLGLHNILVRAQDAEAATSWRRSARSRSASSRATRRPSSRACPA